MKKVTISKLLFFLFSEMNGFLIMWRVFWNYDIIKSVKPTFIYIYIYNWSETNVIPSFFIWKTRTWSHAGSHGRQHFCTDQIMTNLFLLCLTLWDLRRTQVLLHAKTPFTSTRTRGLRLNMDLFKLCNLLISLLYIHHQISALIKITTRIIYVINFILHINFIKLDLI